jgi:hypothetical protein
MYALSLTSARSGSLRVHKATSLAIPATQSVDLLLTCVRVGSKSIWPQTPGTFLGSDLSTTASSTVASTAPRVLHLPARSQKADLVCTVPDARAAIKARSRESEFLHQQSRSFAKEPATVTPFCRCTAWR